MKPFSLALRGNFFLYQRRAANSTAIFIVKAGNLRAVAAQINAFNFHPHLAAESDEPAIPSDEAGDLMSSGMDHNGPLCSY